MIRARRRIAIAAALPLLLALAPLFCAAPPARAGTEEFSTFDVESPEEDDESLLDHFETRTPYAWRDEWERSAQALRTSQGCLTSGQWFIDTDLRVRSSLGEHALFGLDLRQSESDLAQYEYYDFSFRFETPFGAPGFMFRPAFDKSRQDFGFLWEAGADSTTHHLQLAFTIEDMFNNLWAFRQTRVGNEAEPYERHPYEPAFRYLVRHDAWRVEVGGLWLTPSRKRVVGFAPGSPPQIATLWGAHGWAEVEARALGIGWGLRADNRQARSTSHPIDDPASDNRNFRRMWFVEASARGRPAHRLGLDLSWVYQARAQNVGPPVGPDAFAALDRMLVLETNWTLTPNLHATVGGMYDRISIAHSGVWRYHSYGSRKESRAFIGLMARFGRVSMRAIEGIELDSEPYPVWFVHDKGFLTLQTTF